jgi:acetyl-CoA acetyltransferase
MPCTSDRWRRHDAEHGRENVAARSRSASPLGISGAPLARSATDELQRGGGKFDLAIISIGVRQGIALALERV